jgi:hypothetical protein
MPLPLRPVINLDPISANCPAEILGYVVKRIGGAAVPIIPSDVGSMRWAEYRIDPPVYAPTLVLTGSGSLVVADSIFDPPLTGSVWTKGPNGFNMVANIPGSGHPFAALYRVNLILVAAAGDESDLWFEWQVQGLPQT